MMEDDYKPRFANAQIGDEVYCELMGDGIIMSIYGNDPYLLIVKFYLRNIKASYNIDGKYYDFFLKATLFYRQGEKRNLTERPKRKIKKVIEGWLSIREKSINSQCIAFTSHLYSTAGEAELYGNHIGRSFGEPVFIHHEYEAEE